LCIEANKIRKCDERIQGIKKLVWKTGVILKLLALSEALCRNTTMKTVRCQSTMKSNSTISDGWSSYLQLPDLLNIHFHSDITFVSGCGLWDAGPS
jgi:hypothetical protein